ncbi:alpha/beta hydrolase [Novosphingobium sp.]|uniref:alpha/beta hydrolase n=1 Tax=Novosphingobium sp. TaxID=1874826 RepID=UPI003D096A65
MQSRELARAIGAMGMELGPDTLARCRALFDAEQTALAQAVPVLARDLAYGPDARHRLDLYGTPDGAPKPVIVFVHGGGFVQGDKGGSGGDMHWANAAVGRMAAQRGWIGAVINYRLAPDHGWPAGSQDVAAAIAFLSDNVAQYDGDPAKIVVIGTSAGAVHIAGYLRLVPDHQRQVCGAVLLSGLYGYTPIDARDERYYGAAATYADKAPLEAVAGTALPLLVASAQYDPDRFQAEFIGLCNDRRARHGTMPRAVIMTGHNHYTMAMHLGTSDTRLADEIAAFIEDLT